MDTVEALDLLGLDDGDGGNHDETTATRLRESRDAEALYAVLAMPLDRTPTLIGNDPGGTVRVTA